MEFDLFYSTGANSGPYQALHRALQAACARMRGNPDILWTSVRDADGVETVLLDYSVRGTLIAHDRTMTVPA